MELSTYLKKKLNISLKESKLLENTIKEYVKLKEEKVDNSYLPKNIVKQINTLADQNGDLVLSDMFEVFMSNMHYFMGDATGKKFFSLYSHGLNLEDLKNFTPETVASVDDDEVEDIIRNYSNEIEIPTIKFTNPIYDKMYRELYVYTYPEFLNTYDTTQVILNLRDIKKYIAKDPEFKRIFDQKEEGKTLINKIATKEIVTLQDAIEYIQSIDSGSEMSHGRFLVEDNIEIDIKKWKVDKDTHFKGNPHYIFVVSLTDDAYEEFKDEADANYSSFKVPHFGRLSGFLDYYKDETHSHTIVTIPNKFCIGWVRFTILSDESGEKKIIVDELQSDLNIVEKFDKYKTGLPEGYFKEFFISQENLYTFLFKQFISYVRENLGYGKIYAVEYDTKVSASKMDRDFTKYKSIPSEDLTYLQQMKPPKFPYNDIIKKNFNFSKTRSDLKGFVLLEKKKK